MVCAEPLVKPSGSGAFSDSHAARPTGRQAEQHTRLPRAPTVRRECSAMAHPPDERDYAGPLLKRIQSPVSPSSVAITTVDEQALDRILSAIGNKFIPPRLDRIALWTAIKEAAKGKDVVDRARGPRSRAIIKAMKRIGKAADALASVIKENGDFARLIAKRIPNALLIVRQLIELSAYTERELSVSNEYIRRKYDRVPSSREWLIGVELPNIFEEFFKRKAGRSRGGGAPSGPTVNFIAAVMNEVDRPIAAETIVRAMTHYSELRRRRRSVRAARTHWDKVT